MGLIPARAGSTLSQMWSPALARAHPRPCGEHLAHRSRRLCPWGSSPPVRGARCRGFGGIRRGGLIPARAGSTHQRPEYGVHGWAHPRPCGEHDFQYRFPAYNSGSSPPVRGAQEHDYSDTYPGGLIPARAGSTSLPSRSQPREGAHPRPCGEHRSLFTHDFGHLGSSPPVRGALR